MSQKNIYACTQTAERRWMTYVDDFVEVCVLPRCVFILTEHILYGLCGQQVAHFFLFKVQGGVVVSRQGLDVGQPGRAGISPFT